ncbi:MAG: PilZ domain-containing protein [Xanthobacteraceae bacterium]
MGAEHRTSTRRRVEQPVLMRSAEGAIVGQCTMLDISPGGARLKVDAAAEIPELFTLLLSKLDGRLKRHCVVAWREDKQVGVRFVTEEDFVSAIVTSA